MTLDAGAVYVAADQLRQAAETMREAAGVFLDIAREYVNDRNGINYMQALARAERCTGMARGFDVAASMLVEDVIPSPAHQG